MPTSDKNSGLKKPKGILKKKLSGKGTEKAKLKKKKSATNAQEAGDGADPQSSKVGLVRVDKDVSGQSLSRNKEGSGKPLKTKSKMEPLATKKQKSDQGAPRAWKMEHDEIKGRIMIATRNLHPGEIVLEEKPLVAATWHAHRCLECHEPHDAATCAFVLDAYPGPVASNLQKIEKFMKGLDGIGELDIARRLIKLLNMCRGDDKVETHTRPCTAENMPACMDTIRRIRANKTARNIIPDGMSDESAARLLSVLNTNSHELGEWGGSGFFLLACLMEHSCRPNCSFNTDGTDLWVTVIEPVRAGAALSIDYTDSVFEPVAARRAHLEASYGFACVCAACTSEPDLTRAFLCPACAAKLCPRGQGLRPSDWQCSGCGRQLKQKERERYRRLEAALEQEPPQDVEEVDEVLEHGVFHGTHFVALQPLQELGELAAKDPAALGDGTAEQVWRRVIAGAEEVLPQFHGHKAILWDNLAQVLVATGQREAAKEAFRRSYEVTKVSAGEGTRPTLTAEALFRKPPQSTEELAMSYANVREQLASMQRFGLQGLAFLADNALDRPS